MGALFNALIDIDHHSNLRVLSAAMGWCLLLGPKAELRIPMAEIGGGGDEPYT